MKKTLVLEDAEIDDMANTVAVLQYLIKHYPEIVGEAMAAVANETQ